MGSVAITGAGGYIGQRLISYLETQDGCTQILGTDIAEPEVASEKLTFLKRDIRDHSLIDFWKDRDVDTTKAKEMLGWKPKFTSSDTLRIMFQTHGYTVVD